MKATITSTDAIVEIDAVGTTCGMAWATQKDKRCKTQARVWEGVTEAGVPFTAYIPLVQVHKDTDNQAFERELQEHKAPEDWTRRAIDARFIPVIAAIFIEPHERYEAVEAYRDKLSQEQIDEIYDAPESAIVQLRIGVGSGGTQVTVIEEG